MEHMLEILEKGTPVRLVISGDEICKACPNCKNNICVDSACGKMHYDQKVLDILGFYENQVMDQKNFFPGLKKKFWKKGKERNLQRM